MIFNPNIMSIIIHIINMVYIEHILKTFIIFICKNISLFRH